MLLRSNLGGFASFLKLRHSCELFCPTCEQPKTLLKPQHKVWVIMNLVILLSFWTCRLAFREKEWMDQGSWGRKGSYKESLALQAGERGRTLRGWASRRRAWQSLGADHFVQLRRGLWQFCSRGWSEWFLPLLSTPHPSLPRVPHTLVGARHAASNVLSDIWWQNQGVPFPVFISMICWETCFVLVNNKYTTAVSI